jgi:hypothetical protein
VARVGTAHFSLESIFGLTHICDVTSGSRETINLSIPRDELVPASSGNLVFFGGGWNENSELSHDTMSSGYLQSI